jgi:hypothetical protein
MPAAVVIVYLGLSLLAGIFLNGRVKKASDAIKYRRVKRPDSGTQFGCTMLLGRGNIREVDILHYWKLRRPLSGGAPGGA